MSDCTLAQAAALADTARRPAAEPQRPDRALVGPLLRLIRQPAGAAVTALVATIAAQDSGPPGSADVVCLHPRQHHTDIEAARAGLGRTLRQWRIFRQLSQVELAAKTGYSRSTVGDLENARPGSLGSWDVWHRLDQALGAGGTLAGRRDAIAAMAAVEYEEAQRERRKPPGGQAAVGSPGGAGADPVVAARNCPCCGARLLLVLETRSAGLPVPAQALVPGSGWGGGE